MIEFLLSILVALITAIFSEWAIHLKIILFIPIVLLSINIALVSKKDYIKNIPFYKITGWLQLVIIIVISIFCFFLPDMFFYLLDFKIYPLYILVFLSFLLFIYSLARIGGYWSPVELNLPKRIIIPISGKKLEIIIKNKLPTVIQTNICFDLPENVTLKKENNHFEKTVEISPKNTFSLKMQIFPKKFKINLTKQIIFTIDKEEIRRDVIFST